MSFRDLPIKRKLTLLSMLTSGAALALACLAFVAYEQFTFRRFMVRELSTLAEMIGFNSGSALSFSDAKSAEQTLKALTAQPHIVAACIYDAQGTVFATYQRNGDNLQHWPAPVLGEPRFGENHLDLLRPITIDHERIGTLFLRSTLDLMHERRTRYLLIAGVVMLVAAAGGLLLTGRAQRIISVPVSELAAVARRVATDKDYSVRAKKRGNDELGHLIDGFNEMLTQIQARDAELRRAREELEQRVVERTAALQHATDEAAEKAEQLRFIFEAIPFGVFWVHEERHQTEYLVNRGFSRITRLSEEQLLHQENSAAITHPEDRARHAELRAQLERGDTDLIELEKRYQHPNGDITWVTLTTKVFRGPEGKIAQEVNTLIDITERKRIEAERQRVQNQLLEVSRQAGMAEVATGVLHNVGNVLNSVNVAATVVIEKVRGSKGAGLTRLDALLKQHPDDLAQFLTHDPRGRHVPGYIGTLAAELAAERETIATEMDHLRRHIEHIKEIVAMQQSYAKVSGVSEKVAVIDLVEDALRMNAGALTRHGLEVVRDFRAEPIAILERHKVLQILVNLIRNAKYACDESGRTDKRLTIGVYTNERGIQISVIDNGVGIPAENMTRIFAHGFTTRQDGHGFGLHSGALAAKELGGSLLAHSDGPGRGAEFTLTIPLKSQSQDT